MRRELHANAITVLLRITSALLRNHPLPWMWIVDSGYGYYTVIRARTVRFEFEFELSSGSRSGNWVRSNEINGLSCRIQTSIEWG